MKEQLEVYLALFGEWVINFLPRLLLAFVVLFIGFKIVKILQKSITRMIDRSEIDPEVSSFLISITNIILKIVVLLIAVSILGVEMSALIGLVAAAGFAVGLALQGFLGNFAAGLTIVFFKPYKVGDWVQVSDSFGEVLTIQIFNTILKTPGDKTLVIPNGQVTDNIITNFSTEGKIRLELNIPMAYEESYPKIEKIISDAIMDLDVIMHDPAPQIGIENFDSHNIMVTVRPYIHPNDYWEATFLVHKTIKNAFHANGIKMAYSEGVELGSIGE